MNNLSYNCLRNLFCYLNISQEIFYEKGTEAAAVTVVEMSFTSVGGDGKIHFTVNKPFLFVIMEKESKSIIFIGRVVKPEYNI